MYAVPAEFLARPFHRAEALVAGLTRSVVEGPQFLRVHESVYRHRAHELSFADEVAAARLALPDDARTTGITRLQELGLDHGRWMRSRLDASSCVWNGSTSNCSDSS